VFDHYRHLHRAGGVEARVRVDEQRVSGREVNVSQPDMGAGIRGDPVLNPIEQRILALRDSDEPCCHERHHFPNPVIE
jgi:hypothetical protein